MPLPGNIVGILLLLLLAGSARGLVFDPSLDDVVRGSSLIIVGRTAEVIQFHGTKIAKVSVDQIAIGPSMPKFIYVLADPTFACDVTNFTAGERQLLALSAPRFPNDSQLADMKARGIPPGPLAPVRDFQRALKNRGFQPFFQIFSAGRGQTDIRVLEGHDYVSPWIDSTSIPKSMRIRSRKVSRAGDSRGALTVYRLEDYITALRKRREALLLSRWY